MSPWFQCGSGLRAPRSVNYVFPQGRAAVKRRAVTTALVLLRQELLDYKQEALV